VIQLRDVQSLSIIRQMSEVQHSIKIAARKSGLTPHVIRVWEKRYDAVSPDRTDTNRRRYSEAEIERLTLLRIATHAGHSISTIAKLPIEQLRQIISELQPAPVPAATRAGTAAGREIEASVAAIERLNTLELEEILGRAAVAFGQHGLLEKVVGPLAIKIGELWREGVITAAHEHFASSVIRSFLFRNSKPFAQNGHTPTLIVGTPAGQLHELGAVMVAAAANDLGWRIVYLGTSLPAAEIAGAAIQNHARAVALSIVFPGDDPNLPQELETLRKHLPEEIKIIAGGRAAESYAPTLKRIGAIHSRELSEFYQVLERMRVPA
jgi:MerR family transcriptional regulator, light-induced transcriptional regulator